MSEKAERTEDRLADFTRDRRILLLSLFALLIGSYYYLRFHNVRWPLPGDPAS